MLADIMYSGDYRYGRQADKNIFKRLQAEVGLQAIVGYPEVIIPG